MESCVASVEFQLKVDDSPALTEDGLACKVTVGRAGAGAGGGGVGGGATVFLPQPTVRAAAASAKPSTCLSSWTIRSRECPTRANMVPPAGWVRVISCITIYYTWRKNACPGLREKVKLDCQQSPKEKHRALVRCMNRPVWFQKVFHFGDQLGDSLWPLVVSWRA